MEYMTLQTPLSFSTNSPNLSLRDVNKVCFVLRDFDGGIGSIFDCINCQIHYMVVSLQMDLQMFFANYKIILLLYVFQKTNC